MAEISGVQEILEDLLALGDPKAASLIARARVALEIARTRTALYEISSSLSTTTTLPDAVSVVTSNIHKLLNVDASSITTHLYLRHAPDSTLYDLTTSEGQVEFLAESEDHLLANDDEIFSDEQAGDIAIGVDSPTVTEDSGLDASLTMRSDPRGRSADSEEFSGHPLSNRSRDGSVSSVERDSFLSPGRNPPLSPFHSPAHGPRGLANRGNYDMQIPESLSSGTLDGILSTNFAPLSRDTDGLVRSLSSINLMHLQGTQTPNPNTANNNTVNTGASTSSIGVNPNSKITVENSAAPSSPSPGTPGATPPGGPSTPSAGNLTPGTHNLPPSPSFGSLPRPSHLGLPPLHLPAHGTPSLRSPVRGSLHPAGSSGTLTASGGVTIATPLQAALHVLQTGNSQVINPQRSCADRHTPVLSPLNPAEGVLTSSALGNSSESTDFILSGTSFSNPGPSPFKRANSSLNLLIEEAAVAAGAAEALSQGVGTPRLRTSSFSILSPSPLNTSTVLSNMTKSTAPTEELSSSEGQSAPSPNANNALKASPPGTPHPNDIIASVHPPTSAPSNLPAAPSARQKPTFLAVPFLVPFARRSNTFGPNSPSSSAGIRNTMGIRRASYRRQYPETLEMALLGALVVHVSPNATPIGTSTTNPSPGTDAWSPPPLRRRSSMRQIDELSNEILLEPLSTLSVQFSDCWARLRQAMAAREAQRQAEGLVRILKALSQEVMLPAIITNILGVAYELLNADRVSVFLVDHDRSELVLAVSEDAAGLRIPLKKGIVGKVASSGQPLNIQEAYNSPLFDRTFDQRTGYRTHSILCCPIFGIDGKVTGVIQAINKLSKHRSRTPRESDLLGAIHTPGSLESATTGGPRVLEFTPRDITILRLVADTAGVTLHKARLLQEANAARAASAALVDILHLDEDDAMWGNIHALSSCLVPLAQRLVPCSRMYLYIVDSVKKELFRALGPHDQMSQRPEGDHAAHYEGDGGGALASQLLRFPITEGLPGKAIHMGNVLNIEYPEKRTNSSGSSDSDEDEGARSTFKVRSALVVPIFAPKTKRVVAVLEALNRQGGSPFNKHDEAMLDVFTSEVGGILDKRLMQLTLSKVMADEMEEEKLQDKDKGRLGRFAAHIGGGKISSLLSYYSNAGQVSAIQNQYAAPPKSLKSVALSLIKRNKVERERQRESDKERTRETRASGSGGSAVLALSHRRGPHFKGMPLTHPLTRSLSSSSLRKSMRDIPHSSASASPISTGDDPKHTPIPTVQTDDLYSGSPISLHSASTLRSPDAPLTNITTDALATDIATSPAPALDSSRLDLPSAVSTATSAVPSASTGNQPASEQKDSDATSLPIGHKEVVETSNAPVKSPADANAASNDIPKPSSHASTSIKGQEPPSTSAPTVSTGPQRTGSSMAMSSSESTPNPASSSTALSPTAPSKPLPHIRLMARWRQCPPRSGRSTSQHHAPRSWDFEPLDHHPFALIEFFEDMLHTLDLYNAMHIDPATMHNFLHNVRKAYRPNPYHNFFHGVGVAQIVFTALFKSSAAALAVGGPVNRFALLLCALCHDVDHTGYNNAFESNSLSSLALTYNDSSVLEQHHAATMFSLLRGEERQKRSIKASVIAAMLGTNEVEEDREGADDEADTALETEVVSIFQLPRPVFSVFRKMSIAGILATDMSHHNSLTEKARKYIPGTVVDSPDSDAPSSIPDPVLEMPAQLAIELLVHSADLSNPVLPDFYSSCRWTDLVCSEFREQVQREKAEGLPFAPHMDGLTTAKAIAKLQTGFIDYVVAPLWSTMGQVFVELQPLSVSLSANRQNWQTIYDAPDSKTNGLTNATDAATAVLDIRHNPQVIEPLDSSTVPIKPDTYSPYQVPLSAPLSSPYASYSKSQGSAAPVTNPTNHPPNVTQTRSTNSFVSAASIPTSTPGSPDQATTVHSPSNGLATGFNAPQASGGSRNENNKDVEKKPRSTSRGWLRRLLRREDVT